MTGGKHRWLYLDDLQSAIKASEFALVKVYSQFLIFETDTYDSMGALLSPMF